MPEAHEKTEIRILGRKSEETLLGQVCGILSRYIAFKKIAPLVVEDNGTLTRDLIEKSQSDPPATLVVVPLFSDPSLKEVQVGGETAVLTEPISPAESLAHLIMVRVGETLGRISKMPHDIKSTAYTSAYQTKVGGSIMGSSFEIVRSRIGAVARFLSEEQLAVVERIVHATADPEYAKLTLITKDAVASGIAAVDKGKRIVTDVEMVKAGLTRERLKEFGVDVVTYIDDLRSFEMTKTQDITRAAAAMRVAATEDIDGCIIAIGNAPTAAAEIAKLVNEEKANPALVVATPVGFVAAARAKEEVSRMRTPHVIVRGEKGGSSAAAAAVNAILALASERRHNVAK